MWAQSFPKPAIRQRILFVNNWAVYNVYKESSCPYKMGYIDTSYGVCASVYRRRGPIPDNNRYNQYKTTSYKISFDCDKLIHKLCLSRQNA